MPYSQQGLSRKFISVPALRKGLPSKQTAGGGWALWITSQGRTSYAPETPSPKQGSLLTPVCLKPLNPSQLFSLGPDHRKRAGLKGKEHFFTSITLSQPHPPPQLTATNPEGTPQTRCAHHTSWGHWVCTLQKERTDRKRGQVTGLKVTQLSGHGTRMTVPAHLWSPLINSLEPRSAFHTILQPGQPQEPCLPHPVGALLRNMECMHSLVRGLMLKNRRGRNTLERRTSCHVFPGEVNLCLECLCSAFLPGKTEMSSPPAFPLQADKHSPAVWRSSI